MQEPVLNGLFMKFATVIQYKGSSAHSRRSWLVDLSAGRLSVVCFLHWFDIDTVWWQQGHMACKNLCYIPKGLFQNKWGRKLADKMEVELMRLVVMARWSWWFAPWPFFILVLVYDELRKAVLRMYLGRTPPSFIEKELSYWFWRQTGPFCKELF